MQARPDYDEANPDEVEPYGMDFALDLAAGEQILTATVTLIPVPGFAADPTPSSHLDGVAGWIGSRVSQVLSKLIGGVKYCVLFTVTTSFGNTLELYSHVYCKVPI
jgi:hypothetical protein